MSVRRKSKSSSKLVDKILESLNEYYIEGSNEDLGELLKPLIEACRKVSKNEKEFITCLKESIRRAYKIIEKYSEKYEFEEEEE